MTVSCNSLHESNTVCTTPNKSESASVDVSDIVVANPDHVTHKEHLQRLAALYNEFIDGEFVNCTLCAKSSGDAF